jgi:hypothetical protein
LRERQQCSIHDVRQGPRLACGARRLTTLHSARREVDLIRLEAGGPQPFFPPEQSLVARDEPFSHREQLGHFPFKLHPASASLGAIEAKAEHSVFEVEEVAGLDLPPANRALALEGRDTWSSRKGEVSGVSIRPALRVLG